VKGLPPSSFKPWMKELSDLKAFFDERTKTEKPLTVTVGDPAVTAPDGATTVRAVIERVARNDGTSLERLAAEVRPGGAPLSHGPAVLLTAGDKSFELVWGPKGSGFAVLKWPPGAGGPVPSYLALDLRRGAWLRFG